MSIDPNSEEFMPSALNKAIIDKFLLVLNIPKGLKNINSKILRKNRNINLDALQFSVWGSVVPSINIPAVDLKFMGGNMPISSHARPPWDPVTVNFNIDNIWSNYWVIYSWLNLIRSDQDGFFGELTDGVQVTDGSLSIKDYSTDMTIYSIDEYNKPRIKWSYLGAFPTNLGDIKFSERESSHIECNFTFQFSRLLCELV